MNLQIQSLESWGMTDIKSDGISIQKSWEIKKIMDKNQSEKWDVKMWLKWRYGIEKSNCWDGRLIKNTKISIQKIQKKIEMWKCWSDLKSHFQNWNSKRIALENWIFSIQF